MSRNENATCPTCAHAASEHFEACCFVPGCWEQTGLAPCWVGRVGEAAL